MKRTVVTACALALPLLSLCACEQDVSDGEISRLENEAAEQRAKLEALELEVSKLRSSAERARQPPSSVAAPIRTVQEPTQGDPHILQSGPIQTRYSSKERCEQALMALQAARKAQAEARPGLIEISPTTLCMPG